jgi:hypothetical protein
LLVLSLAHPALATAQVGCIESTHTVTAGGTFVNVQGSTSDAIIAVGCAGCEYQLAADHTICSFSVASTPRHYYNGALICTARYADTYTLIGSESGPVAIDAVLSLGAFRSSCTCYFQYDPITEWANARIGLVRPGVDNLLASTNGIVPLPVAELRFTIATTPGVPFDLVAVLQTYGLAYCCNAPANAYATVHFEGVPNGDFIQSCKGYSSGSPVSARRTTWGGAETDLPLTRSPARQVGHCEDRHAARATVNAPGLA